MGTAISGSVFFVSLYRFSTQEIETSPIEGTLTRCPQEICVYVGEPATLLAIQSVQIQRVHNTHKHYILGKGGYQDVLLCVVLLYTV